MSDPKTPLELAKEVRSLLYICAGCQSCEFVGEHLLGPVPIKPITAICSAIESQAAEIARLRRLIEEGGKLVRGGSGDLACHCGECWKCHAGDWLARAALEEKP